MRPRELEQSEQPCSVLPVLLLQVLRPNARAARGSRDELAGGSLVPPAIVPVAGEKSASLNWARKELAPSAG